MDKVAELEATFEVSSRMPESGVEGLGEGEEEEGEEKEKGEEKKKEGEEEEEINNPDSDSAGDYGKDYYNDEFGEASEGGEDEPEL